MQISERLSFLAWLLRSTARLAMARCTERLTSSVGHGLECDIEGTMGIGDDDNTSSVQNSRLKQCQGHEWGTCESHRNRNHFKRNVL